jgi:hypothetical protein
LKCGNNWEAGKQWILDYSIANGLPKGTNTYTFNANHNILDDKLVGS